MEKVKITHLQASFLIVSTIFPTAVLTVPKAVGKYSMQSAWLSILIATVLAFFTTYMMATVCKWHQGQTIFQVVEKLIGGKASKALGIMLSFYYFSVFFYVLYQFSDFMTSSVMPETPSVVFQIMLVLQIIYALHLGIEVMARANAIIIFFALAAFALSMLFILKKLEWQHMLPLTEVPFSRVLLGAYCPFAWLSEAAIIWLLAPYLKHTDTVRKTALFGVLITGVLLFITILGTLLVYSANYIAFLKYPTFNVFREIDVAGVFQRIDVLFIAIWIGTMMMKAALFMFGAVYCLCEPFQVNQRGFILLPIALLGVMYATSSWRNTQHLDDYSTYTFPIFSLFFNILLPFILFLIVLLRRSRTVSGD